MRTFVIFFKNFLSGSFQGPLSYVLHFVVPIAAFLGMYLLLRMGESASFAGVQAIGLVTYFTMIQGALVTSLVLRDREMGVDKRIAVSPAPGLAYVAGNGAAALLVLSAQVLVFSCFVSFAFPVVTGIGFQALLTVMLVFAATSVCFGFLVCAASDTATGAVMAANVIVLFSSLLGGSFFPVEFMSEHMRGFAVAFPQYWVMKAIRQAQESSPDIALSLGVLVLFGALFLVVQAGIKRYRGPLR